MNKKILKQLSLLSLILGTALGFVTVIPFIGEAAFWILMCLSAVIIILFMKKFELIEIQSVQESAVLGAIIGFIAFIGFSLSYIPLIELLGKVFQLYPNYGVSVALSNAGLGLIIVLVIFMGILCATINAFSGFLTYYGIDLYKIMNEKDNNEQFKLK